MFVFLCDAYQYVPRIIGKGPVHPPGARYNTLFKLYKWLHICVRAISMYLYYNFPEICLRRVYYVTLYTVCYVRNPRHYLQVCNLTMNIVYCVWIIRRCFMICKKYDTWVLPGKVRDVRVVTTRAWRCTEKRYVIRVSLQHKHIYVVRWSYIHIKKWSQ